MPVRQIALAAAALCAGNAFAAIASSQIAIISGASASKGNLAIALRTLCTNAGGTFTEFVRADVTNNTTTPPTVAVDSNLSSYVCATAALTSANYASATGVSFQGTAYAEARVNVNGGSFTAVCLLQSTPFPAGTKCPTPDLYVNPAATSTGQTSTGSTVQYTTTANAAISSGVIAGGLLDVEPAAFPKAVTTGLVLPAVFPAGFAQTFGVAASRDLYNAMFKDQGLGSLSGCTVDGSGNPTVFTPACTPVIGKEQMTTILQNNTFNAAYQNGANFLAPSQVAAGTNLNYARRVDTSGTQASAQNYFLGLTCNGNGYDVIPEGTGNANNDGTGAITVFAFPTTGGVRTQLNLAGYTVGIISGENNQTGQTWRWLKHDGALIGESSAPATAGQTNANNAIAGRYDYWFSSKFVRSANTGIPAFWTNVTNTVSGLALRAATIGLFNDGTVNAANKEGTFGKSGAACKLPVSD